MQSQLYSLPKCPLWTLDTMSSHVECAPPSPSKKIFTYKRFPQRVRPITYMCDMYNNYIWSRGGSRGRVQGLRTPPPEMTCSFLIQLVFCKKKKLCGLSVLKQNKRRVHPLLKKKTGSTHVESMIIKSGPGCSNVGQRYPLNRSLSRG